MDPGGRQAWDDSVLCRFCCYLPRSSFVVGVVSVAMGHGGEMAEFAMDYLPPDLVTAADVALLRPPSALWGYNAQVTDEALNRIAQVITERDVEIAVLRQQLAELRSATGSHPAIAATLLARSKAASARAARGPGGTAPGRPAARRPVPRRPRSLPRRPAPGKPVLARPDRRARRRPARRTRPHPGRRRGRGRGG